MIWQFGVLIWFCFFLFVEIKWLLLLYCLGKFIDMKDYFDEELLNMFWVEKCRFIKFDLVICFRYFYYKVQVFINIVLNSSINFVGKVKDYFF